MANGSSSNRKQPASSRPSRPRRSKGGAFPIVAVGASAGGLDAFRTLLRALPTNTGMGFVLLQHLDPSHPSLLAELLGRETRMPVKQVEDGEMIKPNSVYVIPPDKDLQIFHSRLQLVPRQHEYGLHLPIDYFFRSLALESDSAAIAVVLSGTGSDGVRGLREIRAAGGMTIVQDPTTAEYDGMPRAAINADVVDVIGSPTQIAEEIARLSKHPFLKTTTSKTATPPLANADSDFNKLFVLLRVATGVDFSHYKENTIHRRVERRLLLHQKASLEEYLVMLRHDQDEVAALFRDLLINVTQFFRDPEVFDLLKQRVITEIIDSKKGADTIRVWVPGCSTGEEVYSLLITMLEVLETRENRPSVTVFGTDISEDAIAKARAGIYPSSIRADVTPARLSRYFTPLDEGYQINKAVREMCVFARQDITRDPPFSRMDLVSMRNVLIYMDQELQRKVMSILHYALVPDGFLLLGTSETVGAEPGLFTQFDKGKRVYKRRDVASKLPVELPPASQVAYSSDMPASPADRLVLPTRTFSLQRHADELTLQRYGPPRVIVDANGQIMHFYGDTTPYLEHSTGRASLNVLDMARDGLAMDVKEAIESLRGAEAPFVTRETYVRFPEGYRRVSVEAMPIDSPAGESYTVVIFRELPPIPEGDDGETPDEMRDRREEQLRRELTAVRKHLQQIIEEKDDANEELRAANEEIQSSNEELQSINEELETAKEELQSTNEELTTINDELGRRNLDLAELNDDLNNFIVTVDLPVLVLGPNLEVRLFTPQTQQIAEVSAADVGRPVSHLRLHVDVPEIEDIAASVMRTLRLQEAEVQDRDGRWYEMQVRPYTTGENKIAGVMIRFYDIDVIKRSLDTAQKRARLTGALNEIDWAVSSTLDAEEIMQRVVVEAAMAIGAETAAIAVREEGGWIMEHTYGLPDDLSGVKLPDDENPHAVLAATTNRPVAVNDTQQDRRISREMAKKYNILSTMVVPLFVRERQLGVLFFNWHTHPQEFGDLEMDFALRLGSTISLAVENSRLYERERRIAETLQETVLSMPASVPGVDYAYMYCPASEAENIGGDFYDLFPIDDIKVGVLVGDVSGKGLAAARLTSLARDSVRAYAYEGGSPLRIMARVNNAIRRSSAAEVFATMFFGILDVSNGELVYCSAGHPSTMLRRADKTVVKLAGNAPIVGAYTGFVCKEERVQLNHGDVLVLYTDGIVEARNEHRELFDEARLEQAVLSADDLVDDIPLQLLKTVLEFTGGELSDDAVLLTLSRGSGRSNRQSCPLIHSQRESHSARVGGFAWPGVKHDRVAAPKKAPAKVAAKPPAKVAEPKPAAQPKATTEAPTKSKAAPQAKPTAKPKADAAAKATPKSAPKPKAAHKKKPPAKPEG